MSRRPLLLPVVLFSVAAVAASQQPGHVLLPGEVFDTAQRAVAGGAR